MSKVGGARRSRIAFCVPRRLRLIVTERDGLDAADEVGQRRVHDQVLERVAVRRGDELDAAFGDRSRGGSLEVGTDFVDDDYLGHVVLDGLDHHLVLQLRGGDLHSPRAANAGMGDIAVAGDLVRRVDDDDALVHFVREEAGDLAQHRRLADAGPAEEQDALPFAHKVFDDADGAENGAADAAGQADDAPFAVTDARDAVQRALDAGAVVRS